MILGPWNQQIGDEELVIDGFHDIIRKDRTRHGGGADSFAKRDLNFKKRLDLDLDIESISIELNIKYVKPTIVPKEGRALECKLAGRCPLLKNLHNPFRKTFSFRYPVSELLDYKK